MAAALVAGLGPTLSLAAWSEFLPRAFESGAYVDLLASYERDDTRHQGTNLHWSDLFLKEKLTLYSNGYLYHPRFLVYRMSIGGALKQEDYETSHAGSPGWRKGSGVEYEARLLFLPEHPYNLEVFALRYEPLYKEQAAVQHDSVESSRGAIFQFRQKPWFAHARYIDERTRTGDLSTEVERYGGDIEYFRRLRDGNQLSFTAAANPSRFSNSLGVEGVTSDFTAGMLLDFQRFRIETNLTKDRLDQNGPSGEALESDTLHGYGLLSARLPWNLRSDVVYRYRDSQSDFEDPRGPSEETLEDTERDLRVDLTHKLYQSLATTYTYLHDSRASSAGDSTTTSNALTLNYSKLIPPGRALASVSASRADTSNEGHTDIVDEPHLGTPVPGTFRLEQRSVERGSIVVVVRASGSPPERVRLTENLHYTLTPIAETFDVTVLTLPTRFPVPGTYDFLVSYSLASGDFTLRYDTFGYSGSLELLDNLLTPYYSTVVVRSDLLSGQFPGTPIDSTTNTLGLLVRSGPWRATGEYQKLDWDVTPYRSWRGELQYVGSLSSTTSVYATTAFLDKYYPHGLSEDARGAYTDRMYAGSGNLRREFRSQGLALSFGGAFSRSTGRIDHNSFSMSGDVVWKIGKLDLTAGASAYKSRSEGPLFPADSRLHQYYYVRVRRWLF